MTDVGERLREVLRRRTAGAGSSPPALATIVDGTRRRRRRRRGRMLRTGAGVVTMAIALAVVLVTTNDSSSVRIAVDTVAPATGTSITKSSTNEPAPTTAPPSKGTEPAATATTFGMGSERVSALSDALALLDADHIVWIANSSDGVRRVLVSSDGGVHWTATIQLPADQSAGVAGHGKAVWILAGLKAWSSSDSGTTWRQESVPADGLAIVRLTSNGVIGLTPKGELVGRVGAEPWLTSLGQAGPFIDVCPTAGGGYVGVSDQDVDTGVWQSHNSHDWMQTLSPHSPIVRLICTPDRILAIASNCGMGHCSVQTWVSRDEGGTWTDITPPPYDLAEPNYPLSHTSGYGPVAAPPDQSTWYHGYSIIESDRGAFNFAVSEDDGRSLTTITFAPPKPADVTYLVGPGGFAAFDAKTAWVELNL